MILKKQKTKILLSMFLLLLIVIPQARADLFITQLLYDSEGADDGYEFVELKNTGNEVINLESYKLSIYSGDTWKSAWTGCSECNLFPGEYYYIGENSSFDHEVMLDLQNTKGAINLTKETVSSNVTTKSYDILGYGTSLVFSEEPAADINYGKSLARISFTGDNSIDFIEAETIVNTNNKGVTLDITILNSAPVINSIESITFEDEVSIIYNVSDINGDDDIKFVEFNCSGEILKEVFNESLSVACNSELKTRVIDSNEEPSDWHAVDLSRALFEVKSIEGCEVLPGNNCTLNFELSASENLNFSIEIVSLYGAETIDVNITENFQIQKDEIKIIPIDINIPKGLKSGRYRGLFEITANR